MIHTLGVGVDLIGQHIKGDTTIAQRQIFHTVMRADRFKNRSVLIKLCLGYVARHCIGAHGNDLCVGIEILQPHDSRHVRVRQGVPLGGSQIHRRGCGCGIKAARRDAAPHVVACAKEQDNVGRAVCTKVLDTGDGCHSGVGTQVARILILGIQHLRAGPAVVDAQLCAKLGDGLHPPSLRHVGQQIILRITGTVRQIEAICHGDVACEGRGAGGEDRNHFPVIFVRIGMSCTTGGTSSSLVGVTQGIDIRVGVGVAAGAGMGGITLGSAGGSGYNSFVVMFPIENIHLILIAVIPHGNIDGDCALGGDEVAAVFGKLRVSLGGCHGFDHAVFAKEGHADAVGTGMAILTGLTKGGSIDLVSGVDQNRD